MSDEWTDWIAHDNLGWPRGVAKTSLVIAQMEADDEILCPMAAEEIDWCHGDAVARYKRRRDPSIQALIEMVENLPAPAQPRVDA